MAAHVLSEGRLSWSFHSLPLAQTDTDARHLIDNCGIGNRHCRVICPSMREWAHAFFPLESSLFRSSPPLSLFKSLAGERREQFLFMEKTSFPGRILPGPRPRRPRVIRLILYPHRSADQVEKEKRSTSYVREGCYLGSRICPCRCLMYRYTCLTI